MQRRHTMRHLGWRAGIAAISDALMLSGLYPLVPHALRAIQARNVGTLRTALTEWGMALAVPGLRPAGFLPLPGDRALPARPSRTARDSSAQRRHPPHRTHRVGHGARGLRAATGRVPAAARR